MPLGDPEAKCGCGRQGCWEASIGLLAMLAATGMEEVDNPIRSAELVAERATDRPCGRVGGQSVGGASRPRPSDAGRRTWTQR